MKSKINVHARSVDDTRPVVEQIIMTVTRKEVSPIYEDVEGGGQTYGSILDSMIEDFFLEASQDMRLDEIAFELGDDAQRALRERAMEKRRTAY